MAPAWALLLAAAASTGPALAAQLRAANEPNPDIPNPHIFLQDTPPCLYDHRNSPSSRPGVPCMPAPTVWPWKGRTPSRMELGDRVVASVVPRVAEKDCGGVEMFGDSSWCLKAMKAKDVVGLSYGIEERDLWSEKMGAWYKVPTRLFDCFINPKQSPPMAGKAPNATGPCDPNGPHCYEAPYQAFRTCIAAKKSVIDGRQYDSLFSELEGRAPLSVHLKMDVEGSEWAVLEQLMDREEDLAKIRTLDMEVHFGFRPASDPELMRLDPTQLLERQVQIAERLRTKMTVVGSTLEVYHQSWHPDKDCPQQQCEEPVMYTSKAFQPTQFAVSYVNKGILSEK